MLINFLISYLEFAFVVDKRKKGNQKLFKLILIKLNMKRGDGRGNKKAQFYILAAIIIIFVLIGIFVYGNYAKTRNDYTKIYDLGDELRIETGYVYDYGVYNGTDTDPLIEKWADVYQNYTQNIVEDWVFVYGNEEGVTALYFQKEDTGGICVQVGGGACIPTTEVKSKGHKGTKSAENGTILVNIEEYDYTFELNEGENFFFVIRAGEYTST